MNVIFPTTLLACSWLTLVNALRCTLNTTSPFLCELAVFPCSTSTQPAARSACASKGDFRSADLDAALDVCKKQNMSLVTPIDRATLSAMASMCTTTFVAARRALLPNDCRYYDIDENELVINDNSSGVWNVGEPSVRSVLNCQADLDGRPVSVEDCSQLLCINANAVPPTGCSGQIHDRDCAAVNPSNRPWGGAQCVVCGRRPVTTTTTTTTLLATTTSTTTTTTTTALATTTTATGTVSTSTSSTIATNESNVSISTLPMTDIRSSADTDSTLVIVLSVIGGLLALVVVVGVIVFLLRRRRREQTISSTTSSTTTVRDSFVDGVQYTSWRESPQDTPSPVYASSTLTRSPIVYDSSLAVHGT